MNQKRMKKQRFSGKIWGEGVGVGRRRRPTSLKIAYELKDLKDESKLCEVTQIFFRPITFQK